MSTNVESMADHLLDLPDDDFRDLVGEDTRGKFSGRTPAQAKALSEALRSPEVMHRWYETLLSFQRSVETQLAAKGRDTKSRTATLRAQGSEHNATIIQAEHDRWAAGALRFKLGLEERILEARKLLPDEPSNPATEIINNTLASRVALLESAIRRHRDEFNYGEEDPSIADRELWSVIS